MHVQSIDHFPRKLHPVNPFWYELYPIDHSL
jgi:hypothetical protein